MKWLILIIWIIKLKSIKTKIFYYLEGLWTMCLTVDLQVNKFENNCSRSDVD